MMANFRKSVAKMGRGVVNIARGVRNSVMRSTNTLLQPKAIVFETTDRCNSRCVHCNIWRNETPTADVLTPEELENTLKDNFFQGVGYIILTGGEVALRNDLEDIILGMHRALPKARLQLSTNALLPDRILDVVHSAVQHDIGLDIGVSLDGLGEVHDRIRGVNGNFNKVHDLLQELVTLRHKVGDKLGVSAGIVLSDMTLHSIHAVRRYARDLNIELTEAWYNEAPFYNNVGVHTAQKDLVDIVKYQPSSPLQERWLQALEGKSIKFPCYALYTFFLLKCNGDVAPCLTFSDRIAGNIRHSTPSEIWRSSEMKKVRQLVKNCRGCLNSWGTGWSFEAGVFPILSYYWRHPNQLLEKLKVK